MAASPGRSLGAENTEAVGAGAANLIRHVEILRGFGVPVIVALNRFASDSDAEIAAVSEACARAGAEAVECTHWAEGAAGAAALAEKVAAAAERPSPGFAFLYPDEMPLWEKIETVARRVYKAGAVSAPDRVRRQLAGLAGRRVRRAPGVHGQDAAQPVGRPGAARRAGRATTSRSATSGSPPGPASSSPSAATS